MERMASHRTAAVLLCAVLLAPAAAQAAGPSLEGRAVLPADTFDEDSPPSGAFTGSANGRITPFANQPVQGFSAVLHAGDGSYWAMPDSGYGGAPTSSADFLLRMYRIRPDFKTASGGSGEIIREGFIQLSDPDRRVPFAIEREDRRLTGADFDIESVRRSANGDLWFGDEYGPFLLHTDSTGKLLEEPIDPPPGVVGVDNPLRGSAPATLRRSGGFEGMGLSTDGPCATPGGAEVLHPMLEKNLEGERDTRRRFIYSFSLADGQYTGQPRQYRTEKTGHYIGELVNIDEHRLLAIERDAGERAVGAFKRVYLVDLREIDANGYLVKTQVADLMAIPDAAAVSLPERHPGDFGLGDPFSFPFETIEALLPLDRERLLVLNDNNYPYGNGRNPDHPDDNEAIVVRIGALCAAPDPGPPPADPPPPPPGPKPMNPPPALVPEIPGGLDDVPDADRVGPSATAFRAMPRRFRVGSRATPLIARSASGARRGTVFRFSLRERGSVKIRIDLVRRGRRGVKLRRACVLSRQALLKRGSVRFSGRLGRRGLRPGGYRATITATDSAGNSGRGRSVMLRIVR